VFVCWSILNAIPNLRHN